MYGGTIPEIIRWFLKKNGRNYDTQMLTRLLDVINHKNIIKLHFNGQQFTQTQMLREITKYKIERGRKPNILKFYVNDDLQKATDDAQGENKETQAHIEKVINMSVDMFRHIVALNTYSEPFLALKNNEQRNIIEQLLGITLLSEKAETVKELIRNSKDNIQQEEFNVKAIEEANKRVKEQIDSLKRRSGLWKAKHDSDINYLASQFEELSKIDIVIELIGGIEPARTAILQAFKNGKSVITANKALLATHARELFDASDLVDEDLFYEEDNEESEYTIQCSRSCVQSWTHTVQARSVCEAIEKAKEGEGHDENDDFDQYGEIEYEDI